MRRTTLFTIAASLVLALGLVGCSSDDDGGASPTSPSAATDTTNAPTQSGAGTLSLTSSAFEDSGPIPVKYSCEGENISPPLTIAGVPSDTAALALIMLDTSILDFVHWTVWNIVPGATGVPENTVPQGGVQGTNATGTEGYTGPCPNGEHVYEFTLYALDQELTLEAGAGHDALVEALHGHILSQTTLTGTYTIALPTTSQ